MCHTHAPFTPTTTASTTASVTPHRRCCTQDFVARRTVVLGGIFAAAGVAHFTSKDAFESMVPRPGAWGFWNLPGSAAFHVEWTGAGTGHVCVCVCVKTLKREESPPNDVCVCVCACVRVCSRCTGFEPPWFCVLACGWRAAKRSVLWLGAGGEVCGQARAILAGRAAAAPGHQTAAHTTSPAGPCPPT